MAHTTPRLFSARRAAMRASSSPAFSRRGRSVLKPASWMAWRRTRWDTFDGSKTNRPLSAPRLTAASFTPSMAAATRSMRAEQAAQCMPPMRSSSTVSVAGSSTLKPMSRTRPRISSSFAPSAS